MDEFLTTKEVAVLMRIKERKVYDLVQRSDIPVSRATGKLLFPKEDLHNWLAASSGMKHRAPATITGSHDPLLEAVLRACGSPIAAIWNGSSKGLDLLKDGQASVAAVHIFDPHNASWNIQAVNALFEDSDVVLIEWARRQRGLVFHKQFDGKIQHFKDVKSFKIVARQNGSGAQILWDYMVDEAGLDKDALNLSTEQHTELDAVLSLIDGSAEIAFGLQHLAQRYQLSFLPVIEERVDLLIKRSFYFEPVFQEFLSYCNSAACRELVQRFSGYDFSQFSQVHFNAPG